MESCDGCKVGYILIFRFHNPLPNDEVWTEGRGGGSGEIFIQKKEREGSSVCVRERENKQTELLLCLIRPRMLFWEMDFGLREKRVSYTFFPNWLQIPVFTTVVVAAPCNKKKVFYFLFLFIYTIPSPEFL